MRWWRNLALARKVAFGFGLVYLVVGAVGFAVTADVDFTATSGESLVILELNPLHNVVHLGVGAFLFFGAVGGVGLARGACVVIGAVYVAVGFAGLFAIGQEANILALNHADNGLHLLTGAILFGVGLRPVVQERVSPEEMLGAPEEPDYEPVGYADEPLPEPAPTRARAAPPPPPAPSGDEEEVLDWGEEEGDEWDDLEQTIAMDASDDWPEEGEIDWEDLDISDELGILRPGEAAPVTGLYACICGQELQLEHGKTVPPCPSGEAGEHRFRLLSHESS